MSSSTQAGGTAQQAGRIARGLLRPSGRARTSAWHVTTGGLLIGHDKAEVRIPWPDRTGGKLILIFGKRGTGKTELLRAIQQAAITMGYGVFTINAKADRALSRGSRATAEKVGKTAKDWGKKGPTPYNPYAHGGSLEIADQLLAGEAPGTHPHYLRKAQRFLGHLVRVLQDAGMEISLATIIDHYGEAEFGKLLQNTAQTRATKAARRYLDQLDPVQWKELSGTHDRLAIIPESEVGEWWESGPGAIDLWECSQENGIVNFLVDGDGVPLLSQMMSTAIVLDLNTLLAERNEMIEKGAELEHLFVFIDEFGGIPADISSLAARGRSANVTLILATQDLYADTGTYDGLRDRLLANFDALVSLREQSPRSAEIVSKLGGKVEKKISSWDDKGGKRTAIEEVPRITESQIMDLPDYHGAVILPGRPECERVRVARMLSPEEIASLRYAEAA
jgi:TraM recognition site of TraD and TraG